MLRWHWLAVLAALTVLGGAARLEAAVELSVPNYTRVTPGATVPVSVTVSDTDTIAGIAITLSFDASVVQGVGFQKALITSSFAGGAVWDNTAGTVTVTLTSAEALGPSVGPVHLFRLDFEAVGAADTSTALSFTSFTLRNSAAKTIISTAEDGEVSVVAPAVSPPWLNLGKVYQGATVQGSVGLSYVREVTSITTPDWISVAPVEYYDDPNVWWWAAIHFRVDTTELGPRSGEVVCDTDQGFFSFTISAEVNHPAEALSRVLLIGTPLRAFYTTDPSRYQTLLDLVAATRADVDYLEGHPDYAETAPPADLSGYDAIVLDTAYVSRLTADSPDIARLVSYAGDSPHRRLMVFASNSHLHSVAGANLVLDSFGLHILDTDQTPFEQVLTGDAIADDPLTEGVDQVTIFRGSPVEVGSHTILIRDPYDPFRAWMALNRGDSEVIAIGTSLWWSYLHNYQDPPNDNVRLFTNLFSFAPVAEFSADPVQGVQPLSVQFTDLSRRGSTAWLWDFGDGTTSTAQDPTHEYASPGTYAVRLSVANAIGDDDLTREAYVAVTFPDVPFEPTEYWALYQILACVDAGIVAGYWDGYHPEETVSRAQMAVYLARALAGGETGLEAYTPPAETSFADVATDYWAYKHIEYCRHQNIVAGYWDGYHPEEGVTRAQMAVYMARSVVDPTGEDGLAGYTPPSTASFADVATDYWAYKHVEYCKSQSIVSGYWDGYHPEEAVNRAQMAVYVQRAFGLPV